MELESLARLLLIYVHLMLSVFALRDVLVSDWRVLFRTLRPDELQSIHTRVGWLLLGLWATGLTIVVIDIGFDFLQLSDKPKTIAKLVTVGVLSLNGLLLKHWCFPRISRLEQLGAVEITLVMAAGATSTASWLMAPLLGIAKPLANTSAHVLLGIYAVELVIAVITAIAIGTFWKRRSAVRYPKPDPA